MFTNVVKTIVQTIESGFPILSIHGNRLLFLLLALDFTIWGLYMAMGKNQNISSGIEKVLIAGVMVWIIQNLPALSFMFLDSIIQLSSQVGGTFTLDYFQNPGAVFSDGWNLIAEPIRESFQDTMGGFKAFFTNIGGNALYGLSYILLVLSFAILTLQLALAIIEFHIILYMSLILAPFMVFKPLNFIGSKVPSAIIGQALKLGIISFVVGLSMNIFISHITAENISSFVLEDVVLVTITAAVIAFLALQAPALASSLLSGIPNISASGFMQNAAGMMYAGKSLAGGTKSVATSGAAKAAGSAALAGATGGAALAFRGAKAVGKAAAGEADLAKYTGQSVNKMFRNGM